MTDTENSIINGSETEIADAEDTVTADTAIDTDAPDSDEVVDILASDISELKRDFPELEAIEGITELQNPTRYAALRDLGLTPREAYLATSDRAARANNRAHLTASVPRAAHSPHFGMTHREIEEARELFYGMSDAEIQKLYKKVTR